MKKETMAMGAAIGASLLVASCCVAQSDPCTRETSGVVLQN